MHMLPISVNFISFVCETHIYIFTDYGAIKILYNLYSLQMTHDQKYKFNPIDTEKYHHRYQYEVSDKLRFS